jgi:fumarylacetoacetate (FAA) hydrolase family protein
MGAHHQYPDGMVLYLGTMFAPTKDRGEQGRGFTHHTGDMVTISSPLFGNLVNRVRLSSECPAWTYGTRRLMGDLAAAGLLQHRDTAVRAH